MKGLARGVAAAPQQSVVSASTPGVDELIDPRWSLPSTDSIIDMAMSILVLLMHRGPFFLGEGLPRRDENFGGKGLEPSALFIFACLLCQASPDDEEGLCSRLIALTHATPSAYEGFLLSQNSRARGVIALLVQDNNYSPQSDDVMTLAGLRKLRNQFVHG